MQPPPIKSYPCVFLVTESVLAKLEEELAETFLLAVFELVEHGKVRVKLKKQKYKQLNIKRRSKGFNIYSIPF